MHHKPELLDQYAELVFDKIANLIKYGIWGNVTLDRFNRWKNQFNTEQERYLAAYLAYKLIFFNRKDFLCLVRWSYMEVIRQIALLGIDINFITDVIWEKRLKIASKKLLVCPFSADTPAASGNMVARLLRNQGLISEKNLCSEEQILINLNTGRYNALVFVEDMIGSGNQARDYLNTERIINGQKTTLKKLLDTITIPKYLVVAVAPKSSIESLQSETGLTVISAEILTESNSTLNYSFWYQDEFRESEKFFKKLKKNNKVYQKGYKNNSWTVAFEHGVPNVTCPFYWMETSKWISLIPRRGEDL